MFNKLFLIIAFIALVFTVSCKNDPTSSDDPITVTDIDGNVYKTIQIGDQLWMSENLKVTKYLNGEPIQNVTDATLWANITTDAYSSYNNDDSNIETYGFLYNWYAVKDTRNLAPTGWHIPTDADWKQLEIYLGMSQAEADAEEWRGTDEGGKLKETGITHWDNPNEGATNASGFSGLPGGYRHDSYGLSYNAGNAGFWWSSTEGNSTRAWHRRLDSTHSVIFRRADEKQAGFSVRCIKD